MLAAIKAGYADEYYEVLEKSITAISKAFNNDVVAFRSYAQNVGHLQIDKANSAANIKLTIIVVAGIITLTSAVLAWFALKYIILRPLEQSIHKLEYIAAGNTHLAERTEESASSLEQTAASMAVFKLQGDDLAVIA